jgi:hypothetical protein
MIGFLFPSTLFSAALAATCYDSNGSPASGNAPCTTDDITFCCGDDYTCLSNRLCQGVGNFYVGRCTDQTCKMPNCRDKYYIDHDIDHSPIGKSSVCPKFCSNNQEQEVFQCSSAGTFCCGNSSGACCNDGSDISTGLILEASTIGFISNNVLAPLTTSATTSSSCTTNTSTTASAKNTTLIFSTTSLTSPPGPTVSPLSPGSGSSSNGGAITGGTLGGMAVVCGFILAAWAIKRRQYQKVDNSPHEMDGNDLQRNSDAYEMDGNDS